MNKRELTQEVAGTSGLEAADADRALSGVFEAISRAVARGEKVTVPEFGTFEKRERSARSGRNPQTGEPIEIPATSVPGFKPAAAFKKQVADAAGR